jgi:hypothetical protein
MVGSLNMGMTPEFKLQYGGIFKTQNGGIF